LVSTDGGSSWSEDYAQLNLSAVSCLSDAICIAGGWTLISPQTGSIAFTTDGGTIWQESQYSGEPWTAVTLGCTSDTCFAFGANSTGLVESNNDGASWSRFGVPGGADALTSVTCVPSASTCVFVGPTAGSDPSAHGQALITTNDGSSWDNIGSSLPAATSTISSVSCPASDICYAIGPPLTSGHPIVGLVTTDGGSAWSFVSAPTGVSIPPPNWTGGWGYQDLSCGSSSSCVVVGQDSTGPMAAYTSDGASIWADSSSIG
jgi:photosystem II stability/assembly factor-like uncharacterized protein